MHKSIVAAMLAVSVILSSGSAFAAGCTFNFQSEVTYDAGNNAGDVAAGDFNHDGFDDLAVVNRQSPSIAILLGQQDGTFADPAFTTTTGANQADILAAHMNADNHLDLVVMGGSMSGGAYTGTHVQVLLGDGNGAFTPGDSEQVGTYPYHLAAADFDNDGDTDIAVTTAGTSAGFNLLLNSGGVITQKSVNIPPSANWIDGIAAGDIDADGKMDVAVTATEQNKVWVYYGLGDGTFTAGPILTPAGSFQGPSDIVIADLNRDGAGDLVIANHSSSGAGQVEIESVLSNGSSRTFGLVLDYGNMTGTGASDLLVHDVNTDGHPDAVVAGDSVVYVFPGFFGNFSTQQTFASGGLGLALLDANHDGGADVAATHFGPGTVGIIENTCGAVTLDFSSSANPQTAGVPVTITATVSSPGVPATGTLTITDNGSTLMASTDLATSTTASFTITLGVGTYEFIATYSGDATYSGTSRTLFQVMQPAPFGPPPGFVATSGGGVPNLSWIATADTYQYEVFRNIGSGYQLIATTPNPVYSDTNAPTNAAVLYKVRAINPSLVASDFSAPDFTTTHYFSDGALAPLFHRARRVHLTEVRDAANAARALAGLSAATWTNAVPTVIRAVHVNELRTAINQARTAMGFAASSFTDPTVTTATPIRAAHINEARAALR